MYVFKPGDHVVPLRADRTGCTYEMKKLIGKVLQVYATKGIGDMTVFAGMPGSSGKHWFWHPADLRPATPKEIAASKKPKPLRRGDLVMHRGQIGVVHEIDPDGEDGYWVAMLTGDARCVCRGAEDLTRVGSISKKVKQIKKEMEGCK